MNATLASLIGLGAALGCGSKLQRLGGETGFLESCGGDADCQSGLCACGVCSRTCEQTSQCESGVCATPGSAASCSGETRAVCLPDAPSSDATSAAPSSSAEGCRRAGHYEAGKEGSYLPCCDGLTEVAQLSPAEGNDGPICTEVPARVYACVKGTCGDGECEVGEDVRCGCVEDCPGAAWGNTTPDASTGCEDIGCIVELVPTSSGSVNVRVEFEGQFCPPQFFGSAISIHHAASGALVPRGAVRTDPHACDEECPTPPPPFIPDATAEPFTWDGRVTVADAMDTCEDQYPMPCQTERQFAPPGKYVARLCGKPVPSLPQGAAVCDPSDAVPADVCAEVEFDYPQVEDVVIRYGVTDSATSSGETTQPDSAASSTRAPDAGAAPSATDGGS